MAKIEEIPDEDTPLRQAAHPDGGEGSDEGEEEEEYDLDAPAVSNFLPREYEESISPREHTRSGGGGGGGLGGVPLTTFLALVLAASLAHALLVTQGFLGARGAARHEAVWDWVARVLARWGVVLPRDWNWGQPPGQNGEL
jgi:hypothetical protein